MFVSGVSAGAKQSAALLAAAEDHLGGLLASLYAAMPTLGACGFAASAAVQRPRIAFAKILDKSKSQMSRVADDATSTAVASVGKAIGVDSKGFQELVADAQKVMTEISR